MRAVAEGVDLAGAVGFVAALLAAYLVVGQAVVGGWSQRRFRRTLGRDPFREELQRDWLIECEILGPVHFAHTALAE